jgi:hypothetical protein
MSQVVPISSSVTSSGMGASSTAISSPERLRPEPCSNEYSARGSTEKVAEVSEDEGPFPAEHMPLLVAAPPLEITNSPGECRTPSSADGYVDIRLADVAAADYNPGPNGSVSHVKEQQNLIGWQQSTPSLLRKLQR